MYRIAGNLSFHQTADDASTSTGATVCGGTTVCCGALLLRLAALVFVVAAIALAASISATPWTAEAASITGAASTLCFFIGGRVIDCKGMQWARLFFEVVAPLLIACIRGISSFEKSTASPAWSKNTGCFVPGARMPFLPWNRTRRSSAGRTPSLAAGAR